MPIDTASWYYLNGRWGATYFSFEMFGPGKPKMGSWELPDGRDVVEEIAWGRIADLPFPVAFYRDTRTRGLKRGDLLWSGGLNVVLAGERFLSAIEELGAQFTTYDVDLRDNPRNNTEVEGYKVFIPSLAGEGPVVAPTPGCPSSTVVMRGDVLQKLVEQGINQFAYEPVPRAVAP